MAWTAVAPVPMIPTRLSPRLAMGAPEGSPPVTLQSQRLVWKHAPEKVSMPGMPGSLGRWSGPVPMVTKRARMTSPRSVSILHREAPSSQVTAVTLVDSRLRASRS